MTTRYLHAVAIPEKTLTRPRGSQSERVSAEGSLTSDIPAVKSVAPSAGGQRLSGLVAGRFAELTATELEELFGASGIEVLPYWGDEADPQRDGYYATEDISVERPAADRPGIQQFDGQLTLQGTRRSHRRALRTAPSSVDNPFGSDTTEEIGIPARASKVQWFDDRGGQTTEAATVQRTVDGEHDQIEIYDATEPSFDKPSLIYDIPYEHEWPVDVRVWDDHNRKKEIATSDSGDSIGSATIGSATIASEDNVVAWQRVYRTDHDVVGSFILENDVVRLVLDEDLGRLRVSTWSESDGQYTRVQLDSSSDWRFASADLRYIGVEAVDAQLEFQDTSSSSTHRLNASLKRGYETVLFANPTNAGSVPSGLTDRLDAIAATSDQDPAASADIVAKQDIGV